VIADFDLVHRPAAALEGELQDFGGRMHPAATEGYCVRRSTTAAREDRHTIIFFVRSEVAANRQIAAGVTGELCSPARLTPAGERTKRVPRMTLSGRAQSAPHNGRRLVNDADREAAALD
jgi:hypothetical protein